MTSDSMHVDQFLALVGSCLAVMVPLMVAVMHYVKNQIALQTAKLEADMHGVFISRLEFDRVISSYSMKLDDMISEIRNIRKLHEDCLFYRATEHTGPLVGGKK